MPSRSRPQQRYDHRLRDLVQRTGDLTIATDLGVPSSTARGWLGATPRAVVTLDLANLAEPELRQEILKLRRRVEKLAALLRLALALVHASGVSLSGERLPDGRAKEQILRAVDRARECLPMRAVLRFLGVPRQNWIGQRIGEACSGGPKLNHVCCRRPRPAVPPRRFHWPRSQGSAETVWPARISSRLPVRPGHANVNNPREIWFWRGTASTSGEKAGQAARADCGSTGGRTGCARSKGAGNLFTIPLDDEREAASSGGLAP